MSKVTIIFVFVNGTKVAIFPGIIRNNVDFFTEQEISRDGDVFERGGLVCDFEGKKKIRTFVWRENNSV